MPNPITFNDFLLKAQGTLFGSRDIVVDNVQHAQSVKRGNLIFSSGQRTNDATMAAFRQALQNEYGVFGLHAFDTVVGTRAQLHKSLRACDIKWIHSQMETLKQIRFTNELDTENTPYVWHINLEQSVFSGDPEGYSNELKHLGYALLAVVGNLAEVRFEYTCTAEEDPDSQSISFQTKYTMPITNEKNDIVNPHTTASLRGACDVLISVWKAYSI